MRLAVVVVKRILKLVLPASFRKYLRNVAIKYKIKRKKQNIINSLKTLVPIEVKNSPKYIVSLTSYGKRLTGTAPYAIATILNQTIRPDKVILWVAREDKGKLPSIMRKLTRKGLEIRFCEDLKSYKKLIPVLENFPDDYIITADDDVYYPQNWLEQLIIEHKKYPKKIICHRAHGIKVDDNHEPLPYTKWDGGIDPIVYFAYVFVSQEHCILPTVCTKTLQTRDCL